MQIYFKYGFIYTSPANEYILQRQSKYISIPAQLVIADSS